MNPTPNPRMIPPHSLCVRRDARAGAEWHVDRCWGEWNPAWDASAFAKNSDPTGGGSGARGYARTKHHSGHHSRMAAVFSGEMPRPVGTK